LDRCCYLGPAIFRFIGIDKCLAHLARLTKGGSNIAGVLVRAAGISQGNQNQDGVEWRSPSSHVPDSS
jgi:hypothetical protein